MVLRGSFGSALTIAIFLLCVSVFDARAVDHADQLTIEYSLTREEAHRGERIEILAIVTNTSEDMGIAQLRISTLGSAFRVDEENEAVVIEDIAPGASEAALIPVLATASASTGKTAILLRSDFTWDGDDAATGQHINRVEIAVVDIDPITGLTFEFLPETDTVVRGDSVDIIVVVANSSPAASVEDLRISFSGSDFAIQPEEQSETSDQESSERALEQQAGALRVPPMSSAQYPITLESKRNTPYGAYQIVATASYTWATNGVSVESSQSSIIELTVVRRFEQELGSAFGAAVLFEVLLPVFSAVVAYQLLDGRLFRGEWSWPSFNPIKNVELVWLGAIALIILNANQGWLGIASDDLIGNPENVWRVILAGVVVGAIVPVARWSSTEVERRRRSRWEFTGSESPHEYLRKAFTGPFARPLDNKFSVVAVDQNGARWEGLLLEQRGDGAVVLGSSLNAMVTDDQNKESIEEIVLDGSEVKNAARLVEAVKNNELETSFELRIQKAGEPSDNYVVVLQNASLSEVMEQGKPVIQLFS